MPLTRRAKLLMMLQSGLSIVTLLLVAARAVNILRSMAAELRRRGAAQEGRAEEGAHRPIIERARRRARRREDRAARSSSPLELLVSVMLSAQTTDVNVNRVTEKLFVKYRRPEDYLAVPVEELERDIFATGLLPAEGEVAARDDAAC